MGGGVCDARTFAGYSVPATQIGLLDLVVNLKCLLDGFCVRPIVALC